MFIFVLFSLLLFFDRNQCEMMLRSFSFANSFFFLCFFLSTFLRKQVLEEIITHRVFLNVTYHNSVVILISILVRMLFYGKLDSFDVASFLPK